MKLTNTLLTLLMSVLISTLSAQTGIGTLSPDPTVALHVKARGTQDPLLLEGLRAGSTETSVLVTDAHGKLTYRPAADLFSGGSLWINTLGDISPEANRPVGIGQAAVPTSVILGVTGNQRFTGTGQLQFRDADNYIYSPSSNNLRIKGRDWVSFRNNANTLDVMTVRASSSRVGILNDNPNVDFEVSGTQRMTSDERLEFRDGTNYIHSPGSNNNWYFRGQQYVVFRDRNDAVDILTVQANTDRVGILTRDPQTDFEVNGTQRMRGSNRLEFGSPANYNYIYARNSQDLRFHAFTEANFMNRAGTDFVMSLDANTERVGIRTNDPDVVFDVASNASLTSTGGGVVRIGDGLHVGISQSQIGAYVGNATSPLHLQQFGSSVVIGAGNASTSLLDARGSARVGVMPSVASDDYVVTANTAGDLRNIPWATAKTALGDNMGNHTATDNITIESEHEIRFNSTDKYINRFGDDLDMVNLSGGIHVHADDFIVTNEAIDGIAHFEGSTQRVGFGVEIAPNATVHIDPAGSDFPLRIEDLPLAPTGTYRRLIVDGNGYVYRGRSTVNRNGLVANGPSKNNLRPINSVLSRMANTRPVEYAANEALETERLSTSSKAYSLEVEDIQQFFPQAVDTSGRQRAINYAELAKISFAATRELHAENLALREELAATQQEQLTSMQHLQEQIAKLTRQVNKISPVHAHTEDAAKKCVH